MDSRGYFLVISLLALMSRNLSFANYVECELNGEFEVPLRSGGKYIIQGSVFMADYSRDASVYIYPDTNLVNFVFHNFSTFFTGMMTLPRNRNVASKHLITWGDMGELIGIGELKNAIDEDSMILRHHVFLPGKRSVSKNLPVPVRVKIEELAEMCLRQYVCKDLNSVRPDQLKVGDSDQFGPVSVYSPSVSVIMAQELPVCPIKKKISQENANGLVDHAVEYFVEKIRQKKLRELNVPDTTKEFSFDNGMFVTNGIFKAMNGKFGDLKTLRRRGNAKYVIDGEKHTITSDLEIPNAILKYQNYKLTYGIDIDGKLEVKLGDVTVTGAIEVDFAETPCTFFVKSVKISDFENPTVDATGIGPLSGMIPRIISWVSNDWKKDIIRKVEIEVTKYAQRVVQNIDCDQFRNKISKLF
uniref:Venom protein n=1 Tax=Ampulex compressa TaxID=860918 RepID=A0A1W6EVZ9_AMPCP|nr:venom protein [Ampulex compressa]